MLDTIYEYLSIKYMDIFEISYYIFTVDIYNDKMIILYSKVNQNETNNYRNHFISTIKNKK